MEIKGVSIQKKTNYYKILSVIRNNKDITVKEIKVLNSFLSGEKTKQEINNTLSEYKRKTITHENIGFSAIRGLAHKESYSFFKLE